MGRGKNTFDSLFGARGTPRQWDNLLRGTPEDKALKEKQELENLFLEGRPELLLQLLHLEAYPKGHLAQLKNSLLDHWTERYFSSWQMVTGLAAHGLGLALSEEDIAAFQSKLRLILENELPNIDSEDAFKYLINSPLPEQSALYKALTETLAKSIHDKQEDGIEKLFNSEYDEWLNYLPEKARNAQTISPLMTYDDWLEALDGQMPFITSEQDIENGALIEKYTVDQQALLFSVSASIHNAWKRTGREVLSEPQITIDGRTYIISEETDDDGETFWDIYYDGVCINMGDPFWHYPQKQDVEAIVTTLQQYG